MSSQFYQDPGMDASERIKANLKHDQEQHQVCMWQRARYKGGFGYPPEPQKIKSRMSCDEYKKRREQAKKDLGMTWLAE